jgi:membrane-associated phospholipid phosphatase
MPSIQSNKYSILILLALFMGMKSIAQPHNVRSIDNHMLRTFEKYRTPGQSKFFTFLSKINNPVCLSTQAALLTVGIAKPDSLLRKKSLFGIETIASAEAITFGLKFAINRPRPAIRDTSFTAVVKANNAAFPSGHTSEAFAMATAMSIAVPKWYVIIPAYSWAAMMAYARMYLGVHYPTDVLAGAIVGAGSGYMMYKLNKWLAKNDTQNHPANEIIGMVSGLGAAYILYHVNKWIQKGKHH